MVVVVEGAQALVACHPQSEPFCYAFDGKVAQALNFVLLHNSYSPFRYSLVLVYMPVCAE